MRVKATIGMSIWLVLFVCGIAAAQQAAIKVEALSPHGLEEHGFTSNVSTGLPVVSKGGVVYMSAMDLAGGSITTVSWEMLNRPIGSSATLDSANTAWTTFRTDTTGQYQIKLTVTTSSGTDDTTIIVTSAKYVGVGGVGNVPPEFSQGQCAACHGGAFPGLEDKVTPWKTSGHYSQLQRGLDGILSSHYSSSCIECHTTGYDLQATATNNGFDDQAARVGWTFPTTLQPGNFDTLIARYPQLAQVATIGCESCHGPGSQHYGDATKIGKSLEVGVCASCHDEPWHHNIVSLWDNSKHAELPWSGSFRQQPSSPSFMTNNLGNCIRCHDAQGFINYTNNVGTDTRAISSIQNLTCASCHNPHGSSNPHQLRKVSVDTLASGEAIVAPNIGSGGLCMNCHKGRADGSTYPIVTNMSSHFGPHHSPQTDMYLGKNAHEWGQSIPRSIAHTLVEDACVGCHMSATPDTGTVARDHIGGHSWGMSYMSGGTEYDNVTKCVDCHTGISSFRDIVAAFDYDADGTIEPFVEETEGLRSLLAQALPPFGIDSVSWQLVRDSPDSVRLKKAYYNYEYFEGDASEGVHNPKYAIGILQRSISTLTGVEFKTNEEIPTEFALDQNYPNPFNPTTTIRFSIPKSGPVRLEVFDITGRLVTTLVDDNLELGNYTTVWKGQNSSGAKVSSGVYLYRLNSESFTMTKKMVLVK